MRRVLLGSLLALGLVFGGGAASGAPPSSPGGGPACADLLEGGGHFTAPEDGNPGIYSPELKVAAPSCRGITYTVYVLESDEERADVLGSQAVRGTGSNIVKFDDIVFEDDDRSFCVYATSSAGAHIFDRLPSEGCKVSDAEGRVEYWWYP